MNWKTKYRSIYYLGAPEPDDPVLDPQGDRAARHRCPEYLPGAAGPGVTLAGRAAPLRPLDAVPRADADSRSFRTRQNAGLRPADGHRMPLCPHRMPYQGWPRPLAVAENAGLEQSAASQGRVAVAARAELPPVGDEIVVTKTTDSALTGTNLRLILHNLGIRTVICCGIFTDQCVSSTVRSLADESYAVIVLEDCCAAGSDELHDKELEIINMIYCHVMSSSDLAASPGRDGRIPEQNRSLLG